MVKIRLTLNNFHITIRGKLCLHTEHVPLPALEYPAHIIEAALKCLEPIHRLHWEGA